MKTKIKIAVIAMMGISFGMNAQTEYPVIQPTQKVNNSPWYGLGRSNVIFPSSTHEAIQLGGFYGILLKTGKGDFRFDYNGNLGIGTANPRQKLELYNSNVFNSNMEYQSQDHILLSSSYKNVGEFFGGITWDSGGRRRVSIAATREHSDADFVGLAFFTQGKDGPGPYKESMRISHSGNVGIGIPEPFTNLQIHSASSDSRIALTNNHSGSNVSDGFVLINESDSEVHFLNRENASLKFSTNGKERVRVAADGNLGIGTENPSQKLHISGSDNERVLLSNSAVDYNTNSPKLSFFGFTYGPQITGPSIQKIKTGSYGRGRLAFLQHGGADYTSEEEVMSIMPDGDVGIGTENPSQKLHINGGKLLVGNAEYNTVSEQIRIGRSDNPDIRYHSIFSNHTSTDKSNYVQFRVHDGSTPFTNQVEVMTLLGTGDVGIGTTDTKGFKLGVKGRVAAEEVKIAKHSNWADFVFYDDYKLPTLEEVESHIKEKGHLKDIPSAKEVEENGVFLGEMDSKLLQKIEELTLYTIDQDKEIKALKKQNAKIEQQQKEINELKALVNRLLKAKN